MTSPAEQLNFDAFFFQKWLHFFLNVRFVQIFLKNCTVCTDFFKKIVRIVRIFSKKNCTDFVKKKKKYGLYGFFPKKCTECTDLF